MKTSESQRVIYSFRKALVASVHAKHAQSPVGLKSPKELARAEEGRKGFRQLKEQLHSPKQFLTAKGTQHTFNALNSLRDFRVVSRYK
jgi:hypothetical protein